jgi:hypothetical protein
MKNKILFLLIILLASCTSKDKYDPSTYYSLKEQDQILTSIITHIFMAPPYTEMKDRFKEKHRAFYSSQTRKFKILKYHVAPDSTHYFYLSRPSSVASETRGVAGHFKLSSDYKLENFKEEFVTIVMTEAELIKASFLFEEMVKGNLSNYLGMKGYIQWPNEASSYDSISHEWQLKPEVVK